MSRRLRCRWLCWAAALGMWLLMFAMEPNGACGSSRGLFWRKAITVADTPTEKGICATAITVHGYKCQEFHVTTEDGFVLSMQRIPHGRNRNRNRNRARTKRPPVIVQHGLTCDSVLWFLVDPPEQSLPAVLADSGFDVWLPNTRGTRYSRRHTTLDPNQKAYWDWSWDELVTYELPAIFDYVYKKTGEKVLYVSHSLGTLVGLVSCSQRKMVDKLHSMALLSPIAYLSHMKTLFVNLAARTLIAEALEFLGIAEFSLGGEAMTKLLTTVCSHPEINCTDVMNAITGKSCCVNSSSLEKFFQNYPQSSSTKNMLHLAQSMFRAGVEHDLICHDTLLPAVRSGVLTKFDYGTPSSNIKHYGVPQPPAYNLSNIPNDVPLFICHGGADALADTLDVERLIDDLKFHEKDKLQVKYVENYAHEDFIMGDNAKDMVFDPLISFLTLHQHAL